MTAQAFVDESARGSNYHVCVAVVADGDVDELRRLVRSFCLPGQRRWHFVTERDSRRRQILDAVVGSGQLSALAFYGKGRDTELMHSPQLFPLQMFLVTATSLIAAGLVLTRRSLRLRSAGVTVAGLIALATAAARVLVGWDQPSSALVGMLIGALWALLALSTRSAATDVRTQAVAAQRIEV